MSDGHNPFESGLAHAPDNRAIVAEVVAEDEAKERAKAEAAERAMRDRALAEAATRPNPTGPPKAEFLALDHFDSATLGLLKGRAADLFKQGFCAEAAELYSSAIALQPTSHALHGNRSACRCAHGDYDGALDDALDALRLSPSWAKGYVRHGAALHGLNRFEEAVRAYEEGLKVEASNSALQAGLTDALKRLKAAGGTWDVVVDGSRVVSHSPVGKSSAQIERLSYGRTRAVERVENPSAPTQLGPQLGFVVREKEEAGVPPLALLSAAPFDGGAQILAADGCRPKIFNLRTGLVSREFNTKIKDSGSTTFKECPSGLAIDPSGADGALYACERKSATVYRLLVNDTRAVGVRKEAPDKVLAKATRHELGLAAPAGLCLASTAHVGGVGERVLYVCDAGSGRVLALEPTTLERLFEIGGEGGEGGEIGPTSKGGEGERGEGEGGGEGGVMVGPVGAVRGGVGAVLQMPVAVCACADSLAVADAGSCTIAMFTLRGRFVRTIGERASKFASVARAGVFARPPAHVAMVRGHLFVLEHGGHTIHVLDPESGAPLGMLVPPHNVVVQRDAKGNVEPSRGQGCLSGLCVDDDALYVGTTAQPPRILRLPRKIFTPGPPLPAAPPPATPSGAASEGTQAVEVEVQ